MLHWKKYKKRIISLLMVMLWLVIWQAASALTGLDFILAGPVKVFFCLINMLADGSTYVILGSSSIKILIGFTAALVLAAAAALLSFGSYTAESFFAPAVSVMKSLPVTTFIILVLMAAGSRWVSAVIAFIVVFPVIYYGMLEALKNLDVRLNEMSDVLCVGKARWLRFVALPQCLPYIKASLKTAAGMSWKAGIAAEVIGLPALSIGERMYLSKLYLESDVLLSWGIIIIAAGFVFERVFIAAAQRMVSGLSRYHYSSVKLSEGGVLSNTAPEMNRGERIHIGNVKKDYGDMKVLDNISFDIDVNQRICIMGKSGAGKTTLIRITLGLETADYGDVEAPGRISAVFQEDRLCPWMSALDNVCIVLKKGQGDANRAKEALEYLIGEDVTKKPVSELSGGMRRRCEIVRAMLSESSAVVMDEPFWGLDDDSRAKTSKFIIDNLNGRPLLVATHDSRDIEALHASAFVIDKRSNG